jgi:hypothetical protein
MRGGREVIPPAASRAHKKNLLTKLALYDAK